MISGSRFNNLLQEIFLSWSHLCRLSLIMNNIWCTGVWFSWCTGVYLEPSKEVFEDSYPATPKSLIVTIKKKDPTWKFFITSCFIDCFIDCLIDCSYYQDGYVLICGKSMCLSNWRILLQVYFWNFFMMIVLTTFCPVNPEPWINNMHHHLTFTHSFMNEHEYLAKDLCFSIIENMKY